MSRESIQQQVRQLPDRPGVYLMHDREGKVIYVGKAKSLRKRVSSYFRHGGFASPRLRKLVESIEDLSTLRTSSEAEALILEARLIKQYQPFFNVELKMGERYPYIKITDEEYPRLVVTRVKSQDGALYLGPYVRVSELRHLLRLIERFFPLRACKGPCVPSPDRRPCMNHALGRCLAPCCGLCDVTTYRERVADVVLLLQGKGTDLVERLRGRMDQAARSLAFEEAARLRDIIRGIWRIGRQQPQVIAPLEEEPWKLLLRVQEVLGLPALPWRIEGYDISHTMGGQEVGVRVVFEQGRPNPSLYRRFHLDEALGGDDFRALRETLGRRFRRAGAQGPGSDDPLPQLVLIDGGPVQLAFAREILRELGISLPLVALAKREEELFLPDREEPLRLGAEDPGLRLLQQVRDEAHRFAVTSHRTRRDRLLRKSRLEDIPGIGRTKAAQLLSRYGSARAIERMDPEELARTPGIGPKLAGRILSALKEEHR